MKCEICEKETKELFEEPVEPGKDADNRRKVCSSCHEKAQEKVAAAQKKNSIETADKG